MRSNLQFFLSQDSVFLNKTDCNLQTVNNNLFYLKEDFSKVYIEFVIVSDNYSLKEGENEIVLYTELEKAPYPCYASWFFPGQVLKVESILKYKYRENRVLLSAETGQKIGGTESFHFDMKIIERIDHFYANNYIFNDLEYTSSYFSSFNKSSISGNKSSQNRENLGSLRSSNNAALKYSDRDLKRPSCTI